MLIDGSAVLAELGINPEDLAKAIRADIKEKTGCCASVGMGELMFVLYCKIDQNRVPILQIQTAHLFRVQHPVGSAGDT